MDTSHSPAKRKRTEILENDEHVGDDQAIPSGSSADEITDTLRIAAMVKEDQGYHETEVSFRGETDLQRAAILCAKNTNHTKFILLKNFSIDCLPPAYRDSDTVDLIRAWAALTCRMSVRQISEGRPEFFTGTDKRFPYHTHSGRSDILMTGTGWVRYVRKFTNMDNRSCECEECIGLDLAARTKVWGEVLIRTAAHVICDDVEAANTSCEFFYDDGDTDVSQVPALRKGKVVKCDIKGDYCEIMFRTHDRHLVDTLDKTYSRCLDLEQKLYDRHYKDNNETVTSRDSYFLHKLAVCVSHPHGCCKQISLGKVMHREIMLSERRGDRFITESTQYTYNTPTCPGSSGARVFIPGCRGRLWSICPGLTHVHSEGHPGNTNLSAVMEEGIPLSH